MIEKKVLFVTHGKKQCGVYEFGEDIFNAIKLSKKYNFVKAECDSLKELKEAISKHNPQAIIYNYTPSSMGWLTSRAFKSVVKNNIADIKAIQVGIIHEATQKVADNATAYRNKFIIKEPSKKVINSIFDYYIASDPTLLLQNPLVYKTGRLIEEYKTTAVSPEIPTIGSFGFGTFNKDFQGLVKRVQDEFDEAIINLNIPFAHYGDSDGSRAKQIAAECKTIITKPKITLNISHDYLNKEQLFDFLSKNSLNVFLYKDGPDRGISSVIDYAIAVKRPIAVSNCSMFRHILKANPSVCVDSASLKEILNNGFQPLEKLSTGWDKECLTWEYERILDSVIARSTTNSNNALPKGVKSKINKFFTLPNKTFTWLRNSDKENDDDMTVIESSYTPVNSDGFNRILDNSARAIYKPSIDKLIELVPRTMSYKIPEANVQQAFVFDTVFRFLKEYESPKLLCIGSYEDTASMSLQKLGYKVEEIDPMINYFLQEFYTKPTTQRESYDIIFSTSVIEHDPDDKSFIECMEGLLAPGGIGVLTCDYKDGWKKGDPKPEVDARFYTKNDLTTRLVGYLKSSELIDTPNWDCDNPDFLLAGIYSYTFASFVFKKRK